MFCITTARLISTENRGRLNYARTQAKGQIDRINKYQKSIKSTAIAVGIKQILCVYSFIHTCFEM